MMLIGQRWGGDLCSSEACMQSWPRNASAQLKAHGQSWGGDVCSSKAWGRTSSCVCPSQACGAGSEWAREATQRCGPACLLPTAAAMGICQHRCCWPATAHGSIATLGSRQCRLSQGAHVANRFGMLSRLPPRLLAWLPPCAPAETPCIYTKSCLIPPRFELLFLSGLILGK